MMRTSIFAAAALAAVVTMPLAAQETQQMNTAQTVQATQTVQTAPALPAQTTPALPAQTAVPASAAVSPSTPSTVESAQVQARFAPFAATMQGAVTRVNGVESAVAMPEVMMVRRRARTGQSTALMIVGGVGIILGAAIGGDAGELLMLGSGAVGLYGLYLYLQ